MNWQIQEAKARFSEVVDRAIKEGAQTVTRRGRPVVVIVPDDEYRRLCGKKKSFKEMLASGPLGGIRIKRSKDTGRKIEF